jgi:hypothetical protein
MLQVQEMLRPTGANMKAVDSASLGLLFNGFGYDRDGNQ